MTFWTFLLRFFDWMEVFIILFTTMEAEFGKNPFNWVNNRKLLYGVIFGSLLLAELLPFVS